MFRVLEATVAYATLICTFYYYYYYLSLDTFLKQHIREYYYIKTQWIKLAYIMLHDTSNAVL